MGGPVQLTDRDYCPCESGRRIEACACKVGDVLRPPVVDVTPAGVNSGFAHPDCYLGIDRNCSKQLSREHFISESILKIIELSNNGLTVSGFRWQRDAKVLPTNALASRILCERHNNALSPLDSVALRFYRRLSCVHEHLSKPRGRRDKVFLFNGHDIERWFLKVACGLLASGNAADAKGHAVSRLVNPAWIEILMGRAAIPPGMGLYLTSSVNTPMPMGDRVGFAIAGGDDGTPVGAIAEINGIRFALVLARILRPEGTVLANALHHPKDILFEGPYSRVMLMFGGTGWDAGLGLEIAWSPTAPRI